MLAPLSAAGPAIVSALETPVAQAALVADQSMARASNITVYAVMGLTMLAMLAFAADLGARRSQLEKVLEPERVLVGSDGEPVSGPPRAQLPDQGHRDEAGRVPATRWAAIGTVLTGLAALTMIGAVVLRAMAVDRWPLGNMYEFGMVFCAVALTLFTGWAIARPISWLGLFVAAPVLVVLHMAVFVWYTDASALLPSLRSVWLSIHVGVATVATGVCVIAAVLGGLFLVKNRREQALAAQDQQAVSAVASTEAADGGAATQVAAPAKRRNILDVLPRSGTLERLSYGLNVVGFPLWTFVLISGAIWAEYAWGRYWGWDPKEVWTFVVWVVYAAYLHARATASTSLRTATWVGIAGCLCIIANYTIVNTYFVGLHSYSGV